MKRVIALLLALLGLVWCVGCHDISNARAEALAREWAAQMGVRGEVGVSCSSGGLVGNDWRKCVVRESVPEVRETWHVLWCDHRGCYRESKETP